MPAGVRERHDPVGFDPRSAQNRIVVAVYGNACIGATVADYLIGGTLPVDNLTRVAPAAVDATARVALRTKQ